MMCCLLSQHVCDRKKRRKEGRKGGSREKKLLQRESTCVTKENDNNGDTRDDGNHANTNEFEGKWSAGGSLIGRKAKRFRRLTEPPNVPMRGSGFG